jgi:glycine cleavage system H protein
MPVIMITGYATMRTALQALRKGAFDYIAKPFTRAELQGVVARAGRQAARSGGAERDAPARDAAGPEAIHHLGGHCWVRVDEDGAARIGLEETFARTVGEIEELELPGKGDYVEQGSVCLRILSTDGKTHTVWAPVSGTVLVLNDGVTARPALSLEDPYGEGWLLRLDPANLEEELRGLQ